MMLSSLASAFIHLFFPHHCCGCGSDLLPQKRQLCLHCLHHLPHTGFAAAPDNPVEAAFIGRLPVAAAASLLYYTRGSISKLLVKEMKYKGNEILCHTLGRMVGQALKSSQRFDECDMIIPLPLHPTRLKERGYNQAELLANGIASVLQLPVATDVIARTVRTTTQTKKGRQERWVNMEGKFSVSKPHLLAGRHPLLVDDVLTTGATLEACGKELWKGNIANLFVATLCYAGGR